MGPGDQASQGGPGGQVVQMVPDGSSWFNSTNSTHWTHRTNRTNSTSSLGSAGCAGIGFFSVQKLKRFDQLFKRKQSDFEGRTRRSQGANLVHFHDFNVIFDDGADYIAKQKDESFDIVIVDGIDYSHEDDIEEFKAPSYGNVLFDNDFFRNVFRVLKNEGVFSQYTVYTVYNIR